MACARIFSVFELISFTYFGFIRLRPNTLQLAAVCFIRGWKPLPPPIVISGSGIDSAELVAGMLRYQTHITLSETATNKTNLTNSTR
jgi:hypothetical protein